MQVGTRGKYLRWTGGDNRVASDAGSPGVKSNVSSEWIEYSNARSPSYCCSCTMELRRRRESGEREERGVVMSDEVEEGDGLGKEEFKKGRAGEKSKCKS